MKTADIVAGVGPLGAETSNVAGELATVAGALWMHMPSWHASASALCPQQQSAGHEIASKEPHQGANTRKVTNTASLEIPRPIS